MAKEASSALPVSPEPEPRPTPAVRLLADRAARFIVTAGGLLIIAGILGILVFILVEVAPLTSRAELKERASAAVNFDARALIGDERRTQVAALGLDGRVRVFGAKEGRVVLDRPLAAPPAGSGAAAGPDLAAVAATADGRFLTGATLDGRIFLSRVTWPAGGTKDASTEPAIDDPIVIEAGAALRDPVVFTAASDGTGSARAAALLAGGSIAVIQRVVEENSITSEKSASISRTIVPSPGPLTALLLDGAGTNLYGGTSDGRLVWWRLREGRVEPSQSSSEAAPAVTSLALLTGQRSVVAGGADGSLGVWFPVRRGAFFTLTRVRDLPPRASPIRLLAPASRGRVFLALDATGGLGLYASTSERRLWEGIAPVNAVAALAFTPRADGAWIAGEGRLASLDLDNPHPEISLKALFGRIWYEGYEGPAWVWQSSGGTDDAEPKLSLVPLLAGTLKGTLYSLVLAIPLGVLGAMYASQFMHPRLRGWVKPAVEIMAALPSVVLGFVAGLWLAPRIERVFPALILMAAVLPPLVVAAGLVWGRLPRRWSAQLPPGSEVAFFMAVLASGMGLCVRWSGAFGTAVFGGPFPEWLRRVAGLPFDQRNAVVVGIAMGFAVIPIIFAIAEEAFSNVPQNLSSGSLALGATRWQTVTRLVLPAASPGIFSACMIGFGRAVGETMIVVMATGNTPILDWNPFNGFRSLSANIAVEIPEAPLGGTLYRTLFLAALLLFALTFAVNTVADLVRQRLRRRYAVL